LKYLSEGECSETVLNRYTYSNDANDVDVRINTIQWLKDNKELLVEIAKHPDAKTVTVGGV